MSSAQTSVDAEVGALLRAQEMAGERLVNKIRLAYGAAGLAMAVAAQQINTAEANRIFMVQGLMLLASCGLLFAFFHVKKDSYVPWLKYVTITFDIAVVHTSVLATAVNHSGVIEYYRNFFPLILVLWNLLAGLRYSVAACVYSAVVTAAMSCFVLWWVVDTGLIPVIDESHWDENALNIPDELMRIFFVSVSGLVAAVLANIARRLIRRAEVESRNRAALERQKARLSKYLGGELAEAVVSEQDAFELGGARRQATILFTDIRNFTNMSQDTEPEQVVGLLNSYFSEMVRIVFRYGGTLDKFLGDGLMAVYGAPFDRDHAPLRAVLSAIDMVHAVQRRNDLDPDASDRLRIGAGIATGDVIAGNIGSNERMEYTVIGDAVNLASRLETLNRELGTSIVISAETRDAIADYLPTRALPPLPIRGLRGEHQLYTIDPEEVSAALIRRLRHDVLGDMSTLDGAPVIEDVGPGDAP